VDLSAIDEDACARGSGGIGAEGPTEELARNAYTEAGSAFNAPCTAAGVVPTARVCKRVRVWYSTMVPLSVCWLGSMGLA
jgi:hypothetical protein